MLTKMQDLGTRHMLFSEERYFEDEEEEKELAVATDERGLYLLIMPVPVTETTTEEIRLSKIF